MKLKTIYFFTIVLAGIMFSSCYYDKADLLYGTSASCDSVTTVSYALNVKPLLQQYCYNCHSGPGPSGGIAMGSYSTDKAIAVNGQLYGSISYAGGYSPMPQGAAKFSSCQLAVIKKWIDNNSPNN
jgi:hypothetical protein